MKSKRLWPWTVLILALVAIGAIAGPPFYRWAYVALLPPLLICEARNDTEVDIGYRLEDSSGAFPGDRVARASGAPGGPLSGAAFMARTAAANLCRSCGGPSTAARSSIRTAPN